MDLEFKRKFLSLWKKHFDGAEIPIAFYYTNDSSHIEIAKLGSVPRCVIAAIMKVRKGRTLCFDARSIGCFGGRKYLGFSDKVIPDFEYFLSCGIPGKLEGERYKKSPELVKESMKHQSSFKAPAKYVVFKRWDKLDEHDNPEVVIFFGNPDVISGLITLANFDEAEPNGVISPMGSGCGVMIQAPYREKDSKRPRAVIGAFDVSARPYMRKDELSFSVAMSKFVRMVENMDESFLITGSWRDVKKRI